LAGLKAWVLARERDLIAIEVHDSRLQDIGLQRREGKHSQHNPVLVIAEELGLSVSRQECTFVKCAEKGPKMLSPARNEK
jgi:hypothetical protein